MLKKLYKQLRQEYPKIPPDLTTAVVEFVSGGAREETFAQFCKRMLKKIEFDTQEEREDYIYRILIKTGRETCKNIGLLEILKTAISEAISEVRQERVERKQAALSSPSSLTLTAERTSHKMFDATNKKRRLPVEEHEHAVTKKASQSPRTTPRNH